MSGIDETLQLSHLAAADKSPRGGATAPTQRPPMTRLNGLNVAPRLRDQIVGLGELAYRFGYEQVGGQLAEALVALLQEAEQNGVPLQTSQGATVLPFGRG